MPAHMLRTLGEGGIRRVVIGHTPHGNCPTVVKEGGGAAGSAAVETIMCDTSYSDMSHEDNRGEAVAEVRSLDGRRLHAC